jgi:ATP phosphoribosyltransferase regulatory subunit
MPAFRFVDHEGRVWGLRADVTPGLARVLWQGDPDGPRPRRLFYLAEVYRRAAGRSGPLTVVQAGAEVVGARGPREDAALLSLAAAALRGLGIEDFRLAVGHVGFLRELLDRVGLSREGCDRVLAVLQARDFVGLRGLLQSCLDPVEADRLVRFLTWRGAPAELLTGRGPSPWGGGVEAGWGEDLQVLLEACSGEPWVLVDLGLVRDRAYYTGMVFEILLPGVAQPVGGGGRYDGTLSPEPATGFAFDLGALVEHLPPSGPVRERVRVSAIH